MKRVFLVDDEYLAIEGLRRLVDWKKYDMEVCGVAGDGKSGREMILAQKPDIVFSDIRMPGMNGLDMIAAVKPALPQTLFAIISGYNDFEYVRTALRMSIVDYLDKPVTVEKVYAVLERMNAVFSAREQAAPNMAGLGEAMAELLRLEDVSLLQLKETGERCHANLLGVSNLTVGFLGAKRPESIPAAALEKALAVHEIACVFLPCGGGTLCVMHSERPYAVRDVRACVQSALEEAFASGEVECAGFSAQYMSLCDLKKAEQEASYAARYARFFDEEMVDFNALETDGGSNLSGCRSQIGFALRTGEWQSAMEQVRQTVEVMQKNKLTPELFCHVCLELIYQGLGVCRETGREFEKNGRPFLPHVEISELMRCDEVGRWTIETYDAMIQWLRQRRIQTERKDVLRARKYIDEHFGEPITLEMLSQMCSMHTTYFSVVFKEQIGMTYIKYLNVVRIEKAKQMLLAGEKVKDVGERCGFGSPRYFTEKFKQYTGVTPDQFRKNA